MGVSTDGIVAYGYNLGGVDEGWKVREAGEYGDLELDWWDPEGDDDFVDCAEERLKAAGVEGVEVVRYCSTESNMWVLASEHVRVYRGWVETLDPAAMAGPRPEDDARLLAAVDALGLTPLQESPAWLLVSYWG